jgi:hypothetical protein
MYGNRLGKTKQLTYLLPSNTDSLVMNCECMHINTFWLISYRVSPPPHLPSHQKNSNLTLSKLMVVSITMGNLFSLVLDTYIVSNLISETITKKSLYWRLHALNISLLLEEKAVAIKWEWMTNDTQWDTLLQKVGWSSFCQHSQNSRTEVFHAVVMTAFFQVLISMTKNGGRSIWTRISCHNKMLHVNHVSQRKQHKRNKNKIIWTRNSSLVASRYYSTYIRVYENMVI